MLGSSCEGLMTKLSPVKFLILSKSSLSCLATAMKEAVISKLSFKALQKELERVRKAAPKARRVMVRKVREHKRLLKYYLWNPGDFTFFN